MSDRGGGKNGVMKREDNKGEEERRGKKREGKKRIFVRDNIRKEEEKIGRERGKQSNGRKEREGEREGNC